jgi:hypothetical protein
MAARASSSVGRGRLRTVTKNASIPEPVASRLASQCHAVSKSGAASGSTRC